MKKIIAFLLACALMSVTGCATSVNVPKIEFKNGDKIGYLVEVKESAPIHVHVGTTVFQNFTKTYPYDWQLSKDIPSRLEQSIKAAGFIPVNLSSNGTTVDQLEKLITYKDGAWTMTDEKARIAKKLRQELDLKSIILVRQSRTLAQQYCSQFGCTEWYVPSSGLFTRSIFNFNSFFAVAAFDWDMFTLDPLANLAYSQPVRALTRIPAKKLEKFEPAQFKNLTESEMSAVKTEVLSVVDRTVKALLAPQSP